MSPIITRPSKPGKKLLSVSLTRSVPSIVVLIVSSLVDSKHKRYGLYKSSHSLFRFHEIVTDKMLNEEMTLFDVSHVGGFHKNWIACHFSQLAPGTTCDAHGD